MVATFAQQQRAGLSSQHLGAVLIVDDQPSVRLVLGRLLSGHGYAARQATCLREVMAITDQEKIDAFLIDLTLDHGESGLDVLAWLREQPAHADTPVLVFTGLAEISPTQEELIRQGGASVSYKTDTLRLAVELVKKLLSEHQAGTGKGRSAARPA